MSFMEGTREVALDFNVGLTENLLGGKFTGETEQEKVEFAGRYEEQREKEVQKMMKEMYEEYTSQQMA